MRRKMGWGKIQEEIIIAPCHKRSVRPAVDGWVSTRGGSARRWNVRVGASLCFRARRSYFLPSLQSLHNELRLLASFIASTNCLTISLASFLQTVVESSVKTQQTAWDNAIIVSTLALYPCFQLLFHQSAWPLSRKTGSNIFFFFPRPWTGGKNMVDPFESACAKLQVTTMGEKRKTDKYI